MSYTPIQWENKPSINTPINAENLNHMEQGIIDNSTAIDKSQTDIQFLKSDKQDLLNKGTATQTDFDEIMEIGEYHIDPNVTTKNSPISSYGSLEVVCEAFLLQRFTSFQTNEVYIRNYANNQWYTWQKILTTEIPLLEDTDANLALLNDYKSMTFARYEITNGLAERLGLVNEWFHIINLGRKYGDGYTSQIAVRIGNPGIWMRTSNNERFLDWNKVWGGGINKLLKSMQITLMYCQITKMQYG